MTRNRKTQLAYQKHQRNKPKQEGCGFCSLPAIEIKQDLGDFLVAINLFPYTFWDSTEVAEHFMLVPKRHVTSISQLTPEELNSYAKALADFEKQGFSIYSRGHNSHMKSVLHQHTHLIRLGSKRKKLVFFSEKPHILLTR